MASIWHDKIGLKEYDTENDGFVFLMCGVRYVLECLLFCLHFVIFILLEKSVIIAHQ